MTPNEARCNTLERLLRGGTSRQIRRQFVRLATKGVLSPDPARHPRLTEFLRRYEERLQAQK